MPVHPVAGGFQWGRSGHVYRNRAAAERQGRAAYARGFREDALRRKAKPLRASARAEARYHADIQALLAAVHRAAFTIVHRELGASETEPALRHDGLDDARHRLRRLPEMMRGFLRIHVEQAFDRMATETLRHTQQGAKALGVPIKSIPGLEWFIDERRRENVRLITKASEDFLEQVRQTLTDYAHLPAGKGAGSKRLADLRAGAEPESIAEALQVRASVSKSRGSLIARDQSTRMHGQINKQRQTSAGVKRFKWSTSHDERVRPSHRAIDGQVFSWEEGADLEDEDEPTFPGDPIQCRCVAVPYVEELDEPVARPVAEEEEEPFAAAAEE